MREENVSSEGTRLKTPEEVLGEVETGNLPKKEFKVMIAKMIKELGRMDQQSEKLEVLNKTLENIRKNQTDEEYNNMNKKYTRRKKTVD